MKFSQNPEIECREICALPQGARTICFCSRLLFYSKCSGFTLFGTQLKCDIYYSFFLVYRVKKVKFDHSLSHTPSARSRNVTYIADFSGFKNEND